MNNATDWLRAEWDRILGFACIGMGGLLIFVGYLGASDSVHTPETLSYLISGGIGGLFLLGAGATLLVSADLHDEWRKLDRLEDAFRAGQMGASALDLTPMRTPRDGESRTRQPQEAMRADALSMSPGAAMAVGSHPLAHRVRTLAAVGLSLSLVPVMFGWNHTASRTTDGPAMDGVSIAITGLILAGLTVAASTWWMRRTVQSRARRLLRPFLAKLDSMSANQPGDAVSEQLASPPTGQAGKVLVAEGLTRYHAPGCPAIAGTAAREVVRRDVPSTLSPCQLCLAES